MSWIEWGVLAAGLAVGFGVVWMVMGERDARSRRAPADAGPGAPADKNGSGGGSSSGERPG